jgi:hypothetical protein
MVTASDILKILDKIPEWAGLKAMQARLNALEERCDALEKALAEANQAPKVAPGRPCKACGQAAMRLTGSVPDENFGVLGRNRETWTCGACGHSESQISRKV